MQGGGGYCCPVQLLACSHTGAFTLLIMVNSTYSPLRARSEVCTRRLGLCQLTSTMITTLCGGGRCDLIKRQTNGNQR